MSDIPPVTWSPNRSAMRPLAHTEPGSTQALPALSALLAMRRGIAGQCPACGKGHLFAGWLRVRPLCDACGARLGDLRADDAPPYFTIFIVAHIVIGTLVIMERIELLSVATEMMIFIPFTLALTLGLIRPVKGATLGLMLKLGLANHPDALHDV